MIKRQLGRLAFRMYDRDVLIDMSCIQDLREEGRTPEEVNCTAVVVNCNVVDLHLYIRFPSLLSGSHVCIIVHEGFRDNSLTT